MQALRETSSLRTNILLTPTEHRTWSARAKERGISLAEYIRRGVAASEDAPSEAEMAELEALLAELNAANERTLAKVDETIAQIRYNCDPARDEEVRQRVAEELRLNPIEFDPAILDFSAAA